MATARQWAEGYYEQAKADLHGADLIQGEEPSVFAMLLQMVLEKLAKAALLRGGYITVEAATSSHRAASTLMKQLARNKRAGKILVSLAADFTKVSALVDELEKSHPQFERHGPHLEYPWVAAGEVRWPAAHLEVARKFRPGCQAGVLLFDFAKLLCKRFDQAFR